jgi:hypothetical protein
LLRPRLAIERPATHIFFKFIPPNWRRRAFERFLAKFVRFANVTSNAVILGFGAILRERRPSRKI